MALCVIFNPAARGDKARKLCDKLSRLGGEAVLRPTESAGGARKLAAAAVSEGFETIVAAGGDGTVNEVLNGIGDAQGFDLARLGVLPMGTVNVFARELGLPSGLEANWQLLRQGHEIRIDLPVAEYIRDGKPERRFFVQLAGAGLDARAIELVKWQVKKAVGPLAYVAAGLHALLGAPSKIHINGGGQCGPGELVLIGNGRLYGGKFHLFPNADLQDGLLEVCVLPRVNWFTLARCSPGLLLRGRLSSAVSQLFQAKTFSLESSKPTPVQLDGELVGQLPATFSIEPKRLRVVTSKPAPR